jgi:hypothetical protein
VRKLVSFGFAAAGSESDTNGRLQRDAAEELMAVVRAYLK